MSEWQPIETYVHPKHSPMVLLAHCEKRWLRFGRWYVQERSWYYSGTNERSQWSQVKGDAPTHWQPLPELPDGQ